MLGDQVADVLFRVAAGQHVHDAEINALRRRLNEVDSATRSTTGWFMMGKTDPSVNYMQADYLDVSRTLRVGAPVMDVNVPPTDIFVSVCNPDTGGKTVIQLGQSDNDKGVIQYMPNHDTYGHRLEISGQNDASYDGASVVFDTNYVFFGDREEGDQGSSHACQLFVGTSNHGRIGFVDASETDPSGRWLMGTHTDGDFEIEQATGASWGTITPRFRINSDGYTCLLGTKTDTGDPTGEEGLIYINTFDNKIQMYADGGWRELASW